MTTQQPTLIALSGSLKASSWNRLLVEIAAQEAERLGAQVVRIHLADYPLPLFSEDLEAEGTPSQVNDLKGQFASAQGILLASPEYNGSISGVLKNTIDWLSRPGDDATMGSAFAGKAVGLMATSPGGLGGLRGLNHVRDILFNLGALVHPKQVAIGSSFSAFDDAGQLLNEQQAQTVKAIAGNIVQLSQQLQR